MKSVVLAVLAIVLASTVAHAAPPVEKPLSHYLASATTNVFNRMKTMGNYTKWIANRVPPDQMKDFKAYLKENGIAASAKFPTMKAKQNSVCFTGTKDCLIFSDDSVTFGEATFKVEQKPFRKVVEDACEKIGCSTKTASYSLIPKAHAASRGGKIFWGMVVGAAVGSLAADSLGVSKGKAAGVGAVMGGLGTFILTEEQKHGCGGNCQVAWQPEQCRYQITPPSPVPPMYGQQPAPVEMFGQQQPPYYMPPQVYHQTYGQQHPPCNSNPNPTDLQLALNTPQAPVYCNNTCGQLPPYQPPMYGQPADVTTVPDRIYQSEDEQK